MSRRTIYTSTISVPVYASWKCEKCGKVNFSFGTACCQARKSTNAFRQSKHDEAKAAASNLVQATWADHVLKIILEPNQNAQILRRDFYLDNTNCAKCKTKPKWDRDMKYISWYGLSFLPTLISGCIVLINPTSIVAWLVFLAFLSVIICCQVSESSYKKRIKALSKEYTPVIGSQNQELIEYANRHGKIIPTPDECFEIVNGYDSAINNKHLSEKYSDGVQKSYCRKCGTLLQIDSGFCHKCGTKIISVNSEDTDS